MTDAIRYECEVCKTGLDPRKDRIMILSNPNGDDIAYCEKVGCTAHGADTAIIGSRRNAAGVKPWIEEKTTEAEGGEEERELAE